MITIEPRAAALAAAASNPTKPATATIHDSPDARLVVFRLGPGQSVAPHRNSSTVQITVLEGVALLSGERDGVMDEVSIGTGGMVIYAPNEPHGMRSGDGTVLLLATITPRPGSR